MLGQDYGHRGHDLMMSRRRYTLAWHNMRSPTCRVKGNGRD